MGLNELKQFIVSLFDNIGTKNDIKFTRNNVELNDEAYNPEVDLLPLIIDGTLPGIHELSNNSMSKFQREVMYHNIAKRCSFLKLKQNDQIVHNEQSSSNDLMLIVDGTFK